MTAGHIPQAQLAQLREAVVPNRVTLLYGPRRVGKTTLVQRYIREFAPDALFVSGEDLSAREPLESLSIARLREFVGHRTVLVVDEAQHLRNGGLDLKLLVDHLDGLSVIATASASFDLVQKREPLVGRKRTLYLLPLAQMEIGNIEARHETIGRLPSRLIYGTYPEVVLTESNEERQAFLKELIASSLLRDLLQLGDIRHPRHLLPLLRLVAFRVGSEVSINDLGAQLGMSKNTAGRYLDLLEMAFVLYSRGAYTRNRWKDVSRSRRYYFYDNGVRNALIDDFRPLSSRNDVDALWENYLLTERMKHLHYTGELTTSYFWRTYAGQEVDLVEEWNAAVTAIDTQWSPRRTARLPSGFRRAYPDAAFRVVHRENYLDFITE